MFYFAHYKKKQPKQTHKNKLNKQKKKVQENSQKLRRRAELAPQRLSFDGNSKTYLVTAKLQPLEQTETLFKK